MKKTARSKMFPWRVFTQVVLLQALFFLLALTASGLFARYFYKKQFLGSIEARLKDTLELESKVLPRFIPADWCSVTAKNTAIHIALAKADGTVLCNTENNQVKMSAFLDLLEVQKALSIGLGRAIRKNEESKQDIYYEALWLPSRQLILRVGLPLSEFYETVQVFDTSLGLALSLFSVLFIFLAIWSGQKLVFPIGRLLLKTERLLSKNPDPISKEEVTSDFFGEWSELESNIDDLRKDLEAKSQKLDTERVELATIMAAISDAILAVDIEGVPLFYNSRFQILFAGDALGQKGVKIWEIFRKPDILEAFNAALKEGRASDTKTISWESVNGIKYYFSLSVAPLVRQKSTIYGAVGIFHDVSELKSAEQMRIDFVANVSHELRTPLTSIKGYAETLIQDAENSKPITVEFLKIISRNSNRLMNLMEDLLDLSSLETDHILQRQELSTEEVTSHVMSQLMEKFQAKNQILTFDYKAQWVFADPRRLEQVLVNLLDNASKYTPSSGLIKVTWEPGDHCVLLKISDTGNGIPVEYQSRLFERFYRIDKARSREQGGTGLGLAIVKHIMQRHGGQVSVESKASAGATFVCLFPESEPSL